MTEIPLYDEMLTLIQRLSRFFNMVAKSHSISKDTLRELLLECEFDSQYLDSLSNLISLKLSDFIENGNLQQFNLRLGNCEVVIHIDNQTIIIFEANQSFGQAGLVEVVLFHRK